MQKRMKSLCSNSLTASPRVFGSESMPSFLRSASERLKMFESFAGGGVRPRSMPSRPAKRLAAISRYGFAAGSGLRSSTLVATPLAEGMRMRGLRFFADHAMYTGASYPGTRRLYELTIGFVKTVMLLI